MKKIKLIVASLFSLALVLSCNDDGGDSNRNITTGAVPDITKTEGSEAFINLSSLQDGNDVAISLDVAIAQGQSEVSSVAIVGFYIKADGTIEKANLASGITSFPTKVTISKDILFNAFTSISTVDDFVIGDQLKVSADITLKNGQVINLLKADGTQNYSPDLSNSSLYTLFQTYLVSCPSDLGGEYAFTTTNVGEPGGGTVAGPLTGTVTFTDTGGGIYDISDASFGGWLGLYGPSDDDTSRGVTLIDICGTLSFGGADQFAEIFTISEVAVTGNELSFHWENDYGEYGDTTLTRTDGTDWPPLVSAE